MLERASTERDDAVLRYASACPTGPCPAGAAGGVGPEPVVATGITGVAFAEAVPGEVSGAASVEAAPVPPDPHAVVKAEAPIVATAARR